MADALNLALSATQIALMNRALVRPPRRFGALIPAVVVRERHADRLDVTQHPVERGTQIADHAIKMQAEVVIEAGWSNSPKGELLNLVPTQPLVDIHEIYQQLLRLQSTLTLSDIQTGKRFYTGMLLVDLQVTTDATTESALMATATFRQIVMATTTTLMLGAGATARSSTPATSTPVLNGGSKQLQPPNYYPATPQAGP